VKKPVMILLGATALCAALAACGGAQKPDEPVGRPPAPNDNLTPRKSTTDDVQDSPNKQPQSQPQSQPAPPPQAIKAPAPAAEALTMRQDMTFDGEQHLTALQKLTAGGQNAEAYLSPDQQRLIFQSTRDGAGCDRIYTMKIDGSEVQPVSDGAGVTTCGYFLPGNDKVLFSSTHLEQSSCPPKPDFQKFGGYVWPVHASYEIFSKDLKSGAVTQLTKSPGYDAEATVSPKGDRVVFTSTRDGDLDLYSMKVDGTDVKRLTSTLGYDGGAFFSANGKKIIFRGFHYKSKEEAAEYLALLGQGVVKPTVMELFIMDADGKNMRQITHYNAASFAPFLHPDGERVIFSSNMHDPKGRNFDLYVVKVDGSGLKRITYNPSFDGFPMFTADGKRLVFASNRANQTEGETNVFVANWQD
jgi:TolB protein